MDFHLASHIGNTIIFLVFLAVWAALLRAERKPYLRFWLAGYFAFSIYSILSVINVCLPLPGGLLILRLALISAGALLIAGTFHFLGRRVPRIFVWTAALLVVYAVVVAALGKGDDWITIPVYVFVSAVVCSTGGVVVRAPAPGTGRLIAGLGFIGLGGWVLAYLLIRRQSWYPYVEHSGDLLFILVSSIGVVLMHFEIARREAEASAGRHASLFENALEGLFRATPDGRLVQANPSLLHMLGHTRVEELPRLDDLPMDVAPGEQPITRRLAAGEAIEAEEQTWARADTGSLRVRLRARLSADHEGRQHIEGAAHDVTEERRMQTRLEQAERMEALGRMAGGIAHDFNNILTIIINSLEFAREAVPPKTEAAADLDQVEVAAQRAAALTQQLLAFSRRQVLQRGRLELNGIIQDTLVMLRRTIGEDVNVQFERAGVELHVEAHPGEIQQVLVNLALNARDAMPEGGELVLRTRQLELGDREVARLTVEDTGVGMDARTRERVFEPFFTARPGEGTGLGLATVYGIVRQLEGDIRVESKEGRGSCFLIDLPLMKGDRRGPPGRVEPGSAP
jgi:PAS domain S-box-containing protein